VKQHAPNSPVTAYVPAVARSHVGIPQIRTARLGGGVTQAFARRDWMARGRCREMATAAFFADDAERSAAACLICQECEVRGECLGYAMANGIRWGVWGGTTPEDRKRLRAAARKAS